MSAQMTTGSTVNLGWEDGNMADFLAKRQLAIAAKGWKPLTRRVLRNGERVQVVDRNMQSAVDRYVSPGNFQYLDVRYCYLYELAYDEIVDARGRRSFAAKIMFFGDSYAPRKVPSVVADRLFYVRDDWFVMDEIRSWFNGTCKALSERFADEWAASPRGLLHQSFLDTKFEERELRACTEASGRIPACRAQRDAAVACREELVALHKAARLNDDPDAMRAVEDLGFCVRDTLLDLDRELAQLERLAGEGYYSNDPIPNLGLTADELPEELAYQKLDNNSRQKADDTAPWQEEAA